MTAIDYLIILAYFAIVIGYGFWYQKRASRDLNSYFLAGKRMHWLTLSMSGSVSTFDITGTMWIVSILFILGMKSMWHHWMWGVYMAAFFLAYIGKWVRRSNVMTAAEWMETRFGSGPGGRIARTAYAVMAVVTLAGFIGYAYQGIGKFASVYIPLETLSKSIAMPWIQHLLIEHEADLLAITIIGITTLYVILGGLFSVVVTDVIQTIILTIGSILISYIAWSKLTPEALGALPPEWTSLAIPWRIESFNQTNFPQYELFGAMVIVWVLKGMLLNAGGPAQMYDFQRFLATRTARDAAKMGGAWSLFLIVRWSMCAGIALLALVGIAGVKDPERVMPLVLQDFLPAGIRGLVIAGLLAAFMSTFSSTINSGASFLVRDLWQPFVRPRASEHELVRISYFATLALVIVGLCIGLLTESITQIWNWLMMALGGGVVIPNVLRWYWWRMNGWGYATGTLGGMTLALVALLFDNVPDYYLFPLICLVSLIATIVGSLVTQPVEQNVLIDFYRTVRPFGLWTSVRQASQLSPKEVAAPDEHAGRALLNVLLGMAAITGLYLAPMYLIGHWYGLAAAWFAIALPPLIILKFTWYDYLPED